MTKTYSVATEHEPCWALLAYSSQLRSESICILEGVVEFKLFKLSLINLHRVKHLKDALYNLVSRTLFLGHVTCHTQLLT